MSTVIQAKPGAAKRTRKSRREKMVLAAMQLFAERGYEQTSIEDIGQAADVTGPALYYHFANKEDIFLEAVELASRKVVEAVERSTELPAEEAIDLLLESVARVGVESALWFRALTVMDLPPRAQELVATMSETHVRRWREIIAELRPDLPPALVVSTHLAIRGMLLHAAKDETDPAEAEEGIAFLVESARWLIAKAGVPHGPFEPAGGAAPRDRASAPGGTPARQKGMTEHVNTRWTALGRSGRDQVERIGLGYAGETFDRNALTSALAFTPGDFHAAAVGLLAGDKVTNILAEVTAPVRRITTLKVGLYDAAGVLLASSANATANLATGSASFGLSTPYVVPADGLYYLGIVIVAKTMGSLGAGAPVVGKGGSVGSGPKKAVVKTGQSDIPTTLGGVQTDQPVWLGWN